MSRISGRRVDVAERRERVAGAQGRLEEQVRAGALERQTDDLRKVLGRPPTSPAEVVADVLGSRGAV
ncbi:hypothetical protein ACFV0T_26805 [Streptomyces sp. NPDC059582]|uniref:hypothetical protein n=1 Tax=Streptomyces sp. NPDC059582 TaxID=3346875 RepID=UPI0036C94BE9